MGALLANTAKPVEAASARRKAIEIQRELVAEWPEELEYQIDLAKYLHNLAGQQSGTANREELIELRREALNICEKLVEQDPTTPDYRPSESDVAAFQSELQRLAREKGL